MAVFALRRLRAIVERNAVEEAAVRRFSIRAPLWFAVVVFSMPLLGFLALWLIPWTLAATALVVHYRAARRAIPGGKGTPHGSNAFTDQGQA
jgi:hypothetical protein